VEYLVVAINMDTFDPDLIKLPYSLIVTGNPSGTDAPPGIPAYKSGLNCWRLGTPRFVKDDVETDLVTNSPTNPIPGEGEWRAFKIPLQGNYLQTTNLDIQCFFSLYHKGTGYQVLTAVNALASRLIPEPTMVASSETPVALGDWVYHVPGQFEFDVEKMHFSQYPDTNGFDINCTYPKMVADDWICTRSGPVDDIRFWFSAQGDWFDPTGDLASQISNIHIEFFAAGSKDTPIIRPQPCPGNAWWSADFAPDAPNVEISEYAEGLQGWLDPKLPPEEDVYIPADHTKIFECRITNIPDPYIQVQDSAYWFSVSIATDDSTSPTALLGLKVSDMERYHGDYYGKAYRYGAVHSLLSDVTLCDSIVEPGIDEFLDVSFAINHMHFGSATTCHDTIWEPGELCAFDALQETGYADGNGDCEIDFQDLWLFQQEYGSAGPALSWDLNGDGVVDLTDLAIFASSYGFTVPFCTDPGLPADDCYGTIALSLSPDSSAIVSSGTQMPGLNTVYLVIDTDHASLMECSIQSSPNIVLLDNGVLRYPGVPSTLSCGATSQQKYLSYYYPDGDWPSGPITLVAISYALTDMDPAWIKLEPIPGCEHLADIRWAVDGIGHTYHFDTVLNVAINGGTPPTTSSTCVVVTGVETDEPKPAGFKLGHNYPNPFNPNTTIGYELPEASSVNISIHNVRGQLVRSLVKSVKPAGLHQVTWNGRDTSGNRVASGVYFYRIQAGAFVQTKKLVLLK
jgi:hypothetical protein